MLRPGAARASLLASTSLSATYPVAAKLIYATDGAPLTPAVLTATRFALMATVASLLLTPRLGGIAGEENPNRGFWVAAAELGFWATAGAQFNTAALQHVSVVRGTILLASINILTPLFSVLIGSTDLQRQVPLRVWLACAVALASTVYALADGASLPIGATPGLLPGDELMLGAATCYAIQQVRLSSLVMRHPAPLLAAARLQTQAACSLAFLPFADGGGSVGSAIDLVTHVSATQAGLIGASALGAVVGLLLQYEGQAVINAPSAQPIYAASPIISAIWAYLVLNEPISPSEVLGGAGISAAALLAAGRSEATPRG